MSKINTVFSIDNPPPDQEVQGDWAAAGLHVRRGHQVNQLKLKKKTLQTTELYST